jgi:hypothetical protein
MDLTPTTELEAVNRMLINIGETPINTLENPGVVDAVRARQTLYDTSRTLQAQGWHWNRDRDFTLPTSLPDGEIMVPANALTVTLKSTGCEDVVLRGRRLYDARRHTYSFDRGIVADVVTLLPFDELPEPARQYVTLSACRTFQENVVGSETLSGFDRRDEKLAWASLMNAEAEESNLNVLSEPSVSRVLGR